MIDSHEAEQVLLDWKSKWVYAAEEVMMRFEELAHAPLDEVGDLLSNLETAVDSLKDDIPCEDGIADFVREFQPSEDEYTLNEDVLITRESSTDDIREAGFIELDTLRDIIFALRNLID